MLQQAIVEENYPGSSSDFYSTFRQSFENQEDQEK